MLTYFNLDHDNMYNIVLYKLALSNLQFSPVGEWMFKYGELDITVLLFLKKSSKLAPDFVLLIT